MISTVNNTVTHSVKIVTNDTVVHSMKYTLNYTVAHRMITSLNETREYSINNVTSKAWAKT